MRPIAIVALTALMVSAGIVAGKWVPLALWCVLYIAADRLTRQE